MKNLYHPWNLFRFFIAEHGSFKNCSLKTSLGNPKWLLYGIAVKTPFGTFIFQTQKKMENPHHDRKTYT